MIKSLTSYYFPPSFKVREGRFIKKISRFLLYLMFVFGIQTSYAQSTATLSVFLCQYVSQWIRAYQQTE